LVDLCVIIYGTGMVDSLIGSVATGVLLAVWGGQIKA
ncbi:hypothetical protein ACQWB2_26625, partial [Salmonella enterica subsp. enterica serovar Infantis]